MKTLTYTIAHNLSLLHDELLAACSDLRPVLAAGADYPEPVMLVEGTDITVRLTVPDDADEAAIQTVIDAHDSTATSSNADHDSGHAKLVALGLTEAEIAAL